MFRTHLFPSLGYFPFSIASPLSVLVFLFSPTSAAAAVLVVSFQISAEPSSALLGIDCRCLVAINGRWKGGITDLEKGKEKKGKREEWEGP